MTDLPTTPTAPVPAYDPAIFLNHATTWFTYHAGQRMQSFNFFIAAQAGLAFALFQQWHLKVRCSAISVAGLLVAVAFYALEVRNSTLVGDGRNALLAIWVELSTGKSTSSALEQRFPLNCDLHRTSKCSRWFPWPGDLRKQLDLVTTTVTGSAPTKTSTPRGPIFATHSFVFRWIMIFAAASWALSLFIAVRWL